MDHTAIKTSAPPGPSRLEATAIQAKAPTFAAGVNGAAHTSPALKPLWRRMIEPLASLQLTVILFAASMVIVFYGTWAQVDQGIWHVVAQYFRSWFVMIPLKVLLFHSIEESPFSVPFPGGWSIGALLMCNLLAAHAVRFKLTWKRSGIFILHAGVIVMMVSEFITGMWAQESIMQIAEGHGANYTQDAHNAELALIDVSNPKEDNTVAIPSSALRRGHVTHASLPFDIDLTDYMANSKKVRTEPASNPATAGMGKEFAVRSVPQVSGADPEQKYDLPAAYITLKDKATGQAIDTYLVRFFEPEQTLKFGDKTYELSLRPKRAYKPFFVHLERADFKVYPGTEIPKDYSSHVRIRDKDGKEIRSARIFMNHPLYFNGETYFQSSMEVRGRPIITGLQVVYNPSLGMPLLALVMVGLGMVVHFGMNLIEFLQRRMMA